MRITKEPSVYRDQKSKAVKLPYMSQQLPEMNGGRDEKARHDKLKVMQTPWSSTCVEYIAILNQQPE